MKEDEGLAYTSTGSNPWVGDEGVIAVSGETGRRLHPPDNEPHRRGVLTNAGSLL